MNDYLGNFLPRLREFSKSLNQKELFVDKPWVVENENYKLMYVFERNGILKVIRDGVTDSGTWSYNNHIKRLFINDGQKEYSLQQDFVYDGLMILKLDDKASKSYLFANENLIPDLDIPNYLKKVLISKQNISVYQKVNSQKAYFNNQGEYSTYYDNDLTPLNTTIKFNNGKTVIFKNGKIIDYFFEKKFSTDKGDIFIRFKENEFHIGNFVSGDLITDGIYEISSKQKLIIANHKIAAIKTNRTVEIIVISLILASFLILGIFLSHYNKSASEISKQTKFVDSSLYDPKTDTNPFVDTNKISNLIVADSIPETINQKKVLPFEGYNTQSNLDDLNYSAVDVVKSFFQDLSNGQCDSAWNYTLDINWEKHGEEWFCSENNFGAIQHVTIQMIDHIEITENLQFILIKFFDDESLVNNGINCFDQKLTLSKLVVAGNKRWMITRMDNLTEPIRCE